MSDDRLPNSKLQHRSGQLGSVVALLVWYAPHHWAVLRCSVSQLLVARSHKCTAVHCSLIAASCHPDRICAAATFEADVACTPRDCYVTNDPASEARAYTKGILLSAACYLGERSPE